MGSLAISSLKVSHFRSHRVAKIETDARPVAIFGPNGAGKTNLIEAISILSPGRGLRRSSAQEMTRRPEALGWKVSAQIDGLGMVHEIDTWSDQGAARQVKIDGKSASQVALGKIVRVVWLIPAMDRLWIEGAEGRRRFLDRMTLSFDPNHAEAVLTYEKAMRERNRLLKDQVTDPAWYRAVEAQMAETGVRIRSARAEALSLLSAAQDQAETLFPTADLAITNAEGVSIPLDSNELAEMMATSRPRDLAAGRTLIGPHRDDLTAVYAAKDVPAKDCSTGEQKALLISLILANGRALKSQLGAPPILLLDEVAAHLDQTRRAALYDEICGLGAQAWMTGTGTELFQELGQRAQYVQVDETDGISDMKLTSL